MLPAMAEPTRFLLMFSSTRAAVLLFNTYTNINRLFLSDDLIHLQTDVMPQVCLGRVVFTSLTTLAGTVASHTADFPRPMIQFMAADFLSVQ